MLKSLFVFAIAIASLPASALDLNGCWQARDARIVIDGVESACESGIYFHIDQSPSALAIVMYDFQCRERSPYWVGEHAFAIQEGRILRDGKLAGENKVEATDLRVDSVVTEIGSVIRDSFKWNRVEGGIRFEDEVSVDGKLMHIVRGTLVPASRCLE